MQSQLYLLIGFKLGLTNAPTSVGLQWAANGQPLHAMTSGRAHLSTVNRLHAAADGGRLHAATEGRLHFGREVE